MTHTPKIKTKKINNPKTVLEKTKKWKTKNIFFWIKPTKSKIIYIHKNTNKKGKLKKSKKRRKQNQ